MPFKKGQSGNAKGRPPAEKSFKAALDRANARDKFKRHNSAAEKLLDAAAAGEQWAVKEYADRMDGKATQAITGGDGGPLTVEIVRFANSAS